MSEKPAPHFSGGRNIAMKVPPHLWEATVQFYRDIVGLKLIDKHAPAVGFEFGSNQLWIDKVDGISQAELWLELATDDIPGAAEHFKTANIVRRDEIEPLPEGYPGFWIQNPAAIIHMVAMPDHY
jgi:hypothetical protein